jgi:hypothetical protein
MNDLVFANLGAEPVFVGNNMNLSAADARALRLRKVASSKLQKAQPRQGSDAANRDDARAEGMSLRRRDPTHGVRISRSSCLVIAP